MSDVWCLGSINIDMFYEVPHIPAPGETLAATGHRVGLGGKGANQSVAAARAGARVRHIGAVGGNADWVLERLAGFGVETALIETVSEPTGHAVSAVAADGENAIVIVAGANRALSESSVEDALADGRPGDILLIQNETSLQVEAATMARRRGMKVWYSAAPFDPDAVRAILPLTDTLLVNEIEARQLEDAFGNPLAEMGVENIVVTLGPMGVKWVSGGSGRVETVAGLRVQAVDTTGAGDTFAGYLAAAISEGATPAEAMALATRAAALKVTRRGTADAIPSRAEVEAFRA